MPKVRQLLLLGPQACNMLLMEDTPSVCWSRQDSEVVTAVMAGYLCTASEDSQACDSAPTSARPEALLQLHRSGHAEFSAGFVAHHGLVAYHGFVTYQRLALCCACLCVLTVVGSQ